MAGLIAACMLAEQAIAATPIATTQSATGVTSNSATLTGTVNTNGAPAEWQFDYGTTTIYGQQTAIEKIPAGLSAVHVTAPIGGLAPNTTYHFRLAVVTGIGTNYLTTSYGGDLSFTTKARPNGKLLLASHNLIVSNGIVTARVECASSVACAGKYSITKKFLNKRHKLVGVGCSAASYKIGAGKTSNVRSKLSSTCLSALKAARTQQLTATFSSVPRTPQLGLKTGVRLVLF